MSVDRSPSDEHTPREQPRRRWPAWLLGARFLLAAVGVWLLYVVLVDHSRALEARVVGRLMNAVSGGRVDDSFSSLGQIFVRPGGDTFPFVARITRSCSALTPMAVVAWVALCATRGPAVRRVVGLATALAALAVFDVFRLGLVLLAGLEWGTDAMVVTHDWVGTLVTLVSLVLGIITLWTVSGGRPTRRRALPVSRP